MRRRALLIGLLASPTIAPTTVAQTLGRAAGIGVVTSFSVLADMVQRLAGNLAQVVSLVPRDADVHVYEPTATDSRALTGATLLVENGLGLEGWMTRLGTASGFKGVRIIASAGVTPRMPREGTVTSLDPHAWQDPRDGEMYVRNIADGLATADPGHTAEYHANAAAYIAEVEQTDAWITGQFASIPTSARRIITTHDAFGYYGDRYGITFLAVEGLATDAEPSAKAIAALVAQIRREQAHTVFLENMTDPRLAAMLARETGVTVSGPLYSDALSPLDGPAPTYVRMLRHNTALFERAMRPA